MQFGVALLFCLFILCVSRSIEFPLGLIKLNIGRVAALSVLLLFLNALVLSPIQEMVFNPASLLLLVLTIVWCTRKSGSVKTLQAVVLSIPASLFMLPVQGLALPEPGLFIALIALPFMLPLRTKPPAAMLVAVLSPLLLCVYNTGIELHTYGYGILYLASEQAFDAQIAGIYIAAATAALYCLRQSRRLPSAL